MAGMRNIEGLNEMLLQWDKECVRRILGRPLAQKAPKFIGPEGVMVHVFVEYLCSYILQEAAKMDSRFELQELQRCGNFFEGSNVDVPAELNYLVILKKLGPEVCFFEDVEFSDNGKCKIRVTDRATQLEWGGCLSTDGFLKSKELSNCFTTCVQNFVMLQLNSHPPQISGLLSHSELPFITECVWSDRGLKLTITCPVLTGLSWKMNCVIVNLMPSVKFPGWPSSADFPERINKSHPLYSSFVEAASRGFCVIPANTTSEAHTEADHDDLVWQASMSSVATHVMGISSLQLTCNSCLRLLLMVTGKFEEPNLIEETFVGLSIMLNSAISAEIIKNVILFEIENIQDSTAWLPSKTASRVLSVVSYLKKALQEGSSLRDYVFPGLLRSSEMGNTTDRVRSLEALEQQLKETVHLDFKQINQVEIQEELLTRLQSDERVQKYLEHRRARDFPEHVAGAWQLLAESDNLAHKVYEREPRINILMSAVQFTEAETAYKMIMLCELYRQCLLNDPSPVQSLRTGLRRARQCLSYSNQSSVLEDLDPFVEDALWYAAFSSAFHSGMTPHAAIAHQPLPAYSQPPQTHTDSWNGGDGSAYHDDAYYRSGPDGANFDNTGNDYNDGIHGESHNDDCCNCCDGDGDGIGNCCDCNCNCDGCDCDCSDCGDCVIM
ncbi:uncharacterized protein LOC144442406 [Glandiceps talaboti]